MKNLEKALKDVYEKELLDDVDYAKKQPDHSFSQAHNLNMKSAVKDKPNRFADFIFNHSAKLAGVAVMGLALFMIGTAIWQADDNKPTPGADKKSSEGEFVIVERETSSGINYYLNYEEEDMKTLNEIETFYNPTFIPETYELLNSTEDLYIDYYYSLTFQQNYYTDDGELLEADKQPTENQIFYAQFLKQKYQNVLLENDEIYEIKDKGITYTIIDYLSPNVKSFLWKNEYYVFLVDVPMSFTLEEGLEICRSVEPTNKILSENTVDKP